MRVPSLLSPEEIDARLREVTGWQMAGEAIRRDYSFPAFIDAVSFVNRVAEQAEEMDHHPDITISYTRVTLSITTHVSGGLTRRDFQLAKAIDGLTTEK